MGSLPTNLLKFMTRAREIFSQMSKCAYQNSEKFLEISVVLVDGPNRAFLRLSIYCR